MLLHHLLEDINGMILRLSELREEITTTPVSPLRITDDAELWRQRALKAEAQLKESRKQVNLLAFELAKQPRLASKK